MEYDFFVLDGRSPVYYRCKQLGQDRFELNVVTYSKIYFEFGKPDERVVLTRSDKVWTSEPKQGREYQADLVARVKTWEKENNAPVQTK